MPVDFHVSARRALIARSLSATFFVHNFEHFVIQPRLQRCLVCSCEGVSCPHPSSSTRSLSSTRYGEDLQHIRRAFIKVDHLISQDFNDPGHRRLGSRHLLVSSRTLGSGTVHSLLTHHTWLRRSASRSLRFALSLSLSLSTSAILWECW